MRLKKLDDIPDCPDQRSLTRAINDRFRRIEIEGGGAATSVSGLIDKATFNFNGDRPVYVGTNLAKYRFIASTSGRFTEAVAAVLEPPTASPLYLDILRSRDYGVTWNSIFRTGGAADSNKLVVPVNGSEKYIQTSFASSDVKKDDWLRVDLLAGSGEDARWVNVVLRWEIG